jgi:hypothetical protein
MAHILIVIGVVIAAALLFGGGSVLFYLVISSHEGYEDEAGFHYGPEPFGRSGHVDCVPPAPRPDRPKGSGGRSGFWPEAACPCPIIVNVHG